MVAKKKQVKVPSQESPDLVPVNVEVADKKIRAKRTTKASRLEAELVEVFHTHWLSVVDRITAGEDVAGTRSCYIFASSKRQREHFARQYYDPARALKLATAPVDEVVRLSAIWLVPFYDYIVAWRTEPGEVHKQLCELVAAEYVAVRLLRQNFSPYGNFANASPIPNKAGFGNVYEITTDGFSLGGDVSISKSVADPFSEAECREAMVGIEQRFYRDSKNDEFYSDQDWWIHFRDINLNPIDPSVIHTNVVLNE